MRFENRLNVRILHADISSERQTGKWLTDIFYATHFCIRDAGFVPAGTRSVLDEQQDRLEERLEELECHVLGDGNPSNITVVEQTCNSRVITRGMDEAQLRENKIKGTKMPKKCALC